MNLKCKRQQNICLSKVDYDKVLVSTTKWSIVLGIVLSQQMFVLEGIPAV